MKTPLVVGTESLAFSDREAALHMVEQLRAKGAKHVSRRTDQVDGRTLYIVSWPTSEQLRLDAEETKVLLTQAENLVNVGEGGNTNGN